MSRARNGDVEIEFESFGDDQPRTVLLVNGLGSQMTRWPAALCEKLVARGYRVLRYDNRDVGLSTWPTAPYTLKDMAADGIAVLDAAGVDRAHLAGVSMGGTIVQRMALDHPERVLSMTSIMSATGASSEMQPLPAAANVIGTPPPDPAKDYEAYLAHAVQNAKIIGSPAYPWPEDALRQRAIDEHARAFNPAGVGRQMAAIRGDGDRTTALSGLSLPVVVLHGADDPLLPVAGGIGTAAAIAGADLRVIPGMGHDLPPALYDTFVEAIVSAAERAR